MNLRFPMFGTFALAVLMASGSPAQELSQTQQVELAKIGRAYSQQGALLEGMMAGKFAELALELKRDGLLETKESAKKAARQTNTILKDISGLYAQLVESKVGFILKSKDVLTINQRQHLLAQLQPQVSMPYDAVSFMQPEIFELPINLDRAQRQKMIRLKADLMVKEIELKRDIELVLLDIEDRVMSGGPEAGNTDELVIKLGSLAAKAVDNRVEYFIKAKDSLTLDQKRMLLYLMDID